MRVPKAKDIMSVPDMFLTKEERREKQRRLQEKKEAEKPPSSGVTPSMFQKASIRREQLIAQAEPIQWRDLPFPSFPHVEHVHPLPEVVSTCHVSVVHGRAASLTSEPYFTGARLSSLSKALSSSFSEEVRSSLSKASPSSPPEESPSLPSEESPSSPPENSPPFEDTLQAFLVPLPPTHYQ